MGTIKKIKPLVSICPRCNTENTVTELNVETAGGTGFIREFSVFQNYIDCKNCHYSYIFLNHLADDTIKPTADSIEVLE